MHFVSSTTKGEICRITVYESSMVWPCDAPATHKIGEEIAFDDPFAARHNFTTYVCCDHFREIMGNAVFCP